MDSCFLFFGIIVSFGYLATAAQLDNANDKEGGAYFNVPKKVGQFGEGDPLYGIHHRKHMLYILRDLKSYVEVYDGQLKNDFIKNLQIDGLKLAYDFVGSEDCRSLFIADWMQKGNITTMSTKAQNDVKSFSITETTDISLAPSYPSSDSDLIVTYTKAQKIKEYTRGGSLVREVKLPDEIVNPVQAIKLSPAFGEGYAVCHGYGETDQHRVCLLSNTGEVTDCYGSNKGKGPDNLNICSRIAEDVDGNIIVADLNNKRIILLVKKNGKLRFGKEIVREIDGLQGPTRIATYGPLLYVVDNTMNKAGSTAVSGRVLVYRVRSGNVE